MTKNKSKKWSKYSKPILENSPIASLIDSLQILGLPFMKVLIHDKYCGHSSIK